MWRLAGEESPAESGGDGVVYLDEDYRGYAVVGVDYAECRTCGVEGLGDDEAADDGGVNFGRDVIAEEMGAGGVVPAPVYEKAEKDDVAPINEEGSAVADEFGQKGCGEGCKADNAEKTDVNPGEIAIGVGEVVELGLLADPENAEGHDTHEEDEQARGECDEDAAEIVLGVDGGRGGDSKSRTSKVMATAKMPSLRAARRSTF